MGKPLKGDKLIGFQRSIGYAIVRIGHANLEPQAYGVHCAIPQGARPMSEAGQLTDIPAFDQPQVKRAKTDTKHLLDCLGFTQNSGLHPGIGWLKGKAVCPDGRPFSSGYKLLL
ncbi:hypothetical protein [Stutzerimonas stutzeri]|uniref:hypothetical protein n=1 Tax=Stutzerimonas stutzeri TaxID=316 RepID=UPI00210C1A0F|nr:hypothetical protein [Stutzerimonas stutzeri]MCQ4321627.1 hypothetical protein [Stutzerimonas stutzeri]